MGAAASVDGTDDDGTRRLKRRLTFLRRSHFRAVNFTEAPPELQADDASSEPQWALMSSLIERHTTQLELRKRYAELERELVAKYDERDAADNEFLEALDKVGHLSLIHI